MQFKVFLLLGCIFSLSACSVNDKTTTTGYLNRRYNLVRAGEIPENSIFENEVLDRTKGFVSYLNLFDTKSSFFNFQVKGDSIDTMYCEADFELYNKDGVLLKECHGFKCEYKGYQWGSIVIYDKTIEESLGTIYVYTPYWCRWQMEYEVKEGEVKTITFEFWKGKYNEVPGFIENEE